MTEKIVYKYHSLSPRAVHIFYTILPTFQVALTSFLIGCWTVCCFWVSFFLYLHKPEFPGITFQTSVGLRSN